MRSNENVTVTRENGTQKATSPRSGQKGSLVVIEASVASTLETVVGAIPADVRSLLVTGNVGSR